MCQVKKNKIYFCFAVRPGGKKEQGWASEEGIGKSFGVPLCGTDSGRAVLGKPVVPTKRRHPWVASLIREGSDRLERGRQILSTGKAQSTIWLQAPACGRSGPFRSQTVWYHKKGRVCGGTAGFCHRWSEAEVPAAAGGKRKRHLSVPFSFGAEDGTRTHTPKYWLLRPERLPFRHFRLFHFGPAHSQNSRPTSTRIIPFLALACQFPGLSPPFGGCLSTGVVLG